MHLSGLLRAHELRREGRRALRTVHDERVGAHLLCDVHLTLGEDERLRAQPFLKTVLLDGGFLLENGCVIAARVQMHHVVISDASGG